MKKMETDLKGHSRKKKMLEPPFVAKLGGIQKSSWANDRMPEMLWAVLVIGNLERDMALNFFRYVAKFVSENKDCWNVTISGIDAMPIDKKTAIIEHMTSFDVRVNNILSSLLVFEELPSKKIWETFLKIENRDDAFNNLYRGVWETTDHQSEQSTDCRWIKFLCIILGGRVKFPRKMKPKIEEVFEYPDRGDLRSVRPFIRAAEIMPETIDDKQKDAQNRWIAHFWKSCYDSTSCIFETDHFKDEGYKSTEWEKERKYYFEETVRVRSSLSGHCVKTSTTSAPDYKHEAIFGLGLYGITLCIEYIVYKLDYSIASRMLMRSLTECYITLCYLIQKDEGELWKEYRAYGIGQAKLAYLKSEEVGQKQMPSGFDGEMMRRIANEDEWQEFVSINIGNWGQSDLRKISEECGLKDIYDKFYAWTSGYNHASWASVRETVYESCLNPLHRFHRIPRNPIVKMPTITKDFIVMTNKILEMIDVAYPKYKDRIKTLKPKKEETTSKK